MLKFWSVNHICQVCKLYFYFGCVQHFGQYLYLSVFNEQESVLLSALVKYMLYSHCTENCIYLYSLESKSPCFLMKNWSKSSLCLRIYFAHKTAQLILEKPALLRNDWL